MSASASHAGRAEPLALRTFAARPPASHADLRALRLEFQSRGDLVPARLLLPPQGDGPFPLVLLQHGAGGSKDAEYLDASGGPWARGGAAVLSIDFPLHGERRNAKLSERLLLGLADRAGLARDGGLFAELVRQTRHDLARALDAAERLPMVDAGRIAYASFSLGTILGAAFLAADARPRAAALAIGGGGFGGPGVDPVEHIGRFAPRPLLFVQASRDERIPRAAAEALHAAAGDPKRIEWYDCGHSALPGRALKEMWVFLRAELGIS
jgi:dienelactone hydrolase